MSLCPILVFVSLLCIFSREGVSSDTGAHIRNAISDLLAQSESKNLNTTRQKWADLAHLRASDGEYIDAQDMGVTHCRLFLNGSEFGETLNHNSMFALHVFLRYSHFQGVAHVKGIIR